MKRRKFIRNTLALAAGALVTPQIATALSDVGAASKKKRSRYSHRLPTSDQNYQRSRSYIEDEPIAEYTWASDEAYEAFKDIKYGVRIHWGLYSIWRMNGESWPFQGNLQPPFDFKKRQEYQQLYRTWNPTGFDANEWVSTFKECGMKMFAFTSKHHEGFSMFDTKTRVKRRTNWDTPQGPQIEACDTAYSIMDTPFKRDVVKELCDAAHREGIKIDLYFSHSDWYDADFRPYGYHPLQIPSSEHYTQSKTEKERDSEFEQAKKRQGALLTIVPDPTPEEEARMVARHRAQLTELLTRYGTIDMLCLDIWLGPRVWPQLRQTLLELRKLQPNVMLRARGIGNYGDYYTPERFIPGGKENSDTPWFVISPLGSSFSYEAKPEKHKGAKWVVKSLIDSVSKGGNFMVGIGPDENGRFSPTAIAQLKEVGQWLKANGDGIYATRARDGELWQEGNNVRFTRTKDDRKIFAHCFDWPEGELVLKTVAPKKDGRVTLLGNKAAQVAWKFEPNRGLIINTPEALKLSVPAVEQLAFTFAIET